MVQWLLLDSNSVEIDSVQLVVLFVSQLCACLLQPATVSRCGMIYLEPSTLGWHPMLKSWVNTLPQSLQTDESSSVVFTMFDWLVDPCITFVKKSCKVREHNIITYDELKKNNCITLCSLCRFLYLSRATLL